MQAAIRAARAGIRKGGGPGEKILSVTVSETEEEGGWSSSTYYPSGFMKFEGKESGRGYSPALKNGIYAAVDEEALQKLFDLAKARLAQNPKGDKAQKAEFGYNYTTTVVTNKRDVAYAEDLTSILGDSPIMPKQKPSASPKMPAAPKPKTTDVNWKIPEETKINNIVE